MSKLPMADFRTMDKLLRSLGFVAVRQKGSHVFYRHPDGRTTTLISRPLMREILREISVTPDEFNKLLNEL